MLLAYNSCIAGVCGARVSIGLRFNSFRGYDRRYDNGGYAFCVVACFDLRTRKMVMDMPATRTIGIPALKHAAKATLGFVLLEDAGEVCGTVVPLVEVVVEAVVEAVIKAVIEVLVKAVIEVLVKAVEEAETTD